MLEIVKNYIGKECIIYTINSQVIGVIKEIGEGWISVDNGKNIDAINLDYIIRIRQCPKRKSGKKRSAVVD